MIMDALTPCDYLDELRRKCPEKEFPTEDFNSDYLQSLFQNNPNILDTFKEHSKLEYTDILVKHLDDRVPQEVNDLLRDNSLSIGEINNNSANAHLKKLPNNKYAIAFNTGLKNFVYRVIRAFSTRISFNNLDDPEIIDFNYTARIIADIFLWYGETSSSAGPGYPINEEQIYFANLCSYEANSFFLLHEIGHLLININSDTTFEHDYEEEFLSDSIALSFLLKRSSETDHNLSIQLSYAAAELALYIFAGLESFGVEFDSKSHPIAKDRINNLRETLEYHVSDSEMRRSITAIADVNSVVFDKILETINSTNYRHFIESVSEECMKKLELALEECTGDFVPDYVSFEAQAHQFFGQGYSLKLSEHIAQNTKKLFELMSTHNERDATSDKEVFVVYQKYKLIYSCIERMREPVKSVYMKALGISSHG